MNFEAIIGLEIHVQMRTKSKMFSSAPVTHGENPNTCVNPLDIALPGSMPEVNKQAVINAIRICHALNMSIDDELWFDRKNYFYSDLPKGYQITQYFRPIGRDGWLDVNGKHINIERLHIEEDTAKQLHNGNQTLIDYNRAGIPLLEIVTKPEISSGEEAMRFVEKIRSIANFLDISDGKMEEGSLRVDVNVSIRPFGSKKLGPKMEIKNLNTLMNIKQAIDYEINRQVSTILSGERIHQETRRFDELEKKTAMMRMKTESIDYKYFVEPNIIPIKLSKEFINEAISSSPELAETKEKRYLSLGLNEKELQIILSDKNLCDYFDEMINLGTNPKLAINWINVDAQAVLNKERISIKEFEISPQNLAKLILLVEQGRISNKQAKDIFDKMLDDNADPETIISKMGTSLINDEEALLLIINQVLLENPQLIVDYRNGKDKAVGFIVGKVMTITKGQANPALTNTLVVKRLKGE